MSNPLNACNKVILYIDNSLLLVSTSYIQGQIRQQTSHFYNSIASNEIFWDILIVEIGTSIDYIILGYSVICETTEITKSWKTRKASVNDII
jgi:hypothetical protein